MYPQSVRTYTMCKSDVHLEVLHVHVEVPAVVTQWSEPVPRSWEVAGLIPGRVKPKDFKIGTGCFLATLSALRECKPGLVGPVSG